MISDVEVAAVANQLAKLVETALLEPKATPEQRHEAYLACESFRENSPICLRCAVFLSLNGGNSIVRHFGLQLMEHCIRYKWYEMNQEEKILVRDVATQMLKSTEAGLWEAHLQDALSRVFVEMMKREWPQQWDSLFPDLYEAAIVENRAEIVLSILLRFVEDIFVLQTVETVSRRRDLCQSLTLESQRLFNFLCSLISRRSEISSGGKIALRSLQIGKELLEYVPSIKVVSMVELLIPELPALVLDEDLQCAACDCLIAIAEKRGRCEDKRSTCQSLFRAPFMATFAQLPAFFQPTMPKTSEKYSFVKKACEFLKELSCMACTVADTPPNAAPILAHIPDLLRILLSLCQTPSFTVNTIINSGIGAIFKNAAFRTLSDPFLPGWTSACISSLSKHPYKMLPGLPSVSFFASQDFESEEDYNTVAMKAKMDAYDIWRHVASVLPALALDRAREKVVATLALKSDYAFDWEGTTALFEVVCGNLPSDFPLPVSQGLETLDACLVFDGVNSTGTNILHNSSIISSLLALINAHAVFVEAAPDANIRCEYARRIVNKMYHFMMIGRGEMLREQGKGLKEIIKVRRLASSELVRLALNRPSLLLPVFPEISAAYQTYLNDKEAHLYARQVKMHLAETLIMISNKFPERDRQLHFLREICAKSLLWVQECGGALTDEKSFITHMGVDGKFKFMDRRVNETNMLFWLGFLDCFVRRVDWTHPHPQGGNPVASCILPDIPAVFSLLKILQGLCSPSVAALIAPQYLAEDGGVLAFTEMEKMLLLKGISDATIEENKKHTEGESVMYFLLYSYEMTLNVLSRTCAKFTLDFYAFPNFARSFIHSAFHCLNHLPDIRLKMFVRTLVTTFVQNCPRDHIQDILVPVMAEFAPYMRDRLSRRNEYTRDCRERGLVTFENDEASREFVEDAVFLQLQREYVDFVIVALFKGRMGEEAPVAASPSPGLGPGILDRLSEAGLALMQCEHTRFALISFACSVISWNDSISSYRMSAKLPAIVKQLVANGVMDGDGAVHVMVSLLQSVQVHGQHDENQATAVVALLLAYEVLRPRFPEVLDVLKMIPDVKADDLARFDEKMTKPEGVDWKMSKGLKESFKKIISPVVGKNIGQLHKRKELIRELPKFVFRRPKGESIIDANERGEEVGLLNFFK